ncbi:MAG: pesticidal protein Cry7Aa [Candidatus Saccharibacteria bacterium]
MIKIKKEGIILERTSLPFENVAVLNPAVIKEGNIVHLFYRAVRQGEYSTIGYCRLDGPTYIEERFEYPLLDVELNIEKQGLEDPRIVKIDDLYYLSYTAYDGINSQGVLALSKDLRHFKKWGLISPLVPYSDFMLGHKTGGKMSDRYYRHQLYYYQEATPGNELMVWDKNIVFFPRRIKGKLVFLHSIRPGIQIVSIKTLEELTKAFWDDYFLHFQHHIFMDPFLEHESSYIGSGCPPIETEYGWLLIYHGAKETDQGIVYSACAAALLDLENPSKIITRLPYPLFEPDFLWEKKGEINNMVFPTGTALFGDTLFIYYGAAHEHIACASLSLSKLIAELLNSW